jgi:ribose 5-phosphate isomerase B
LPRDIIAIAADHAGVELKRLLVEELRAAGFEANDLGTNSDASVDYPDFAVAVAREVASGRAARGVLICGTGIGMSIAANRHPGIRAALCTHGVMARFSREHNDANVLVLGSRVIGTEVARECLAAFLSTDYAGGRHAARIAKLTSPSFEETAR